MFTRMPVLLQYFYKTVYGDCKDKYIEFIEGHYLEVVVEV